MSGELTLLVGDVMPYASAAVGAYGGAVLVKVRDEAADATVGLGRRLLQQIFGSRQKGEPLPGPIADVVADPADEDALRLAIRNALAADRQLRAEVRGILERDGGVTQDIHATGNVYNAVHDFNQTIINNYGGAVGWPTAAPEPSPATHWSIDRRVPKVHGGLPRPGDSTRAAPLTPRRNAPPVAAKPRWPTRGSPTGDHLGTTRHTTR